MCCIHPFKFLNHTLQQYLVQILPVVIHKTTLLQSVSDFPDPASEVFHSNHTMKCHITILNLSPVILKE